MSVQPFGSVADDRIVDEVATDNGDPVFTKEEMNRMSNKVVRRLAANANTDVINGKSTRLEITAYFSCQRVLTDYDK